MLGLSSPTAPTLAIPTRSNPRQSDPFRTNPLYARPFQARPVPIHLSGHFQPFRIGPNQTFTGQTLTNHSDGR